MKRERAFSKGGFYSFVLQSNLMLHKHVARAGCQLISQWSKTQSSGRVIRVLDLACGGAPVSISEMMKSLPDLNFDYTGIDINPDQIELVQKRFQFSDNVTRVHLIEGNAWNLSTLPAASKYEIIFTGMNIHHGTPEEILCLMRQIAERLSNDGVFINHDFYRPEELRYLRRPRMNPSDASESFAMVPDDVLELVGHQQWRLPEADPLSDPDWRQPFVKKYARALQERGGHEEGIQEVVSHVLSRDYPVSVPEMQKIAREARFDLKPVDLDAEQEPLGDYFRLVAATRI